MLQRLRVRGLALLSDVTLELGSGLNVLTGETGAGKSLLVSALASLLGKPSALGALRRENQSSQELLHGELSGLAERGSPEVRREIGRTFLRERP